MGFIVFFVILGLNLSLGKGLEYWLTDPDKNILFQQQSSVNDRNQEQLASSYSINIDSTQKYQTIDGFGFALTGGSAYNLYRLENQTRSDILHELFDADQAHIGISYLRLSIGSSDLNDHVFSYDDLSPGESDFNITHFSLDPDRVYLIPLLKEILQINPKIKLLGSPWSPPVWMKTNGKTVGGNLLTNCYQSYALYLVRYIQDMAKEGINITAITIQNEPLYGGNNPSMVMYAEDQAYLIKTYLGPAFKQNSIETQIWIYDHNPDRPDYPLAILGDEEARQYVNGSAFHLYAGQVETLSLIHDLHPDKDIYFTEQWVEAPGNLRSDLAWHIKTLIIGATRNWAKTVIEWNLASDSKWEPHTDGGCDNCLGALTIDNNIVKSPRNPAYYVIAHAAKFVRPNSVRIESNFIEKLPNVAFQREEDQRIVLIVFKDESEQQTTFNISYAGDIHQVSLNAQSVATLII